ncbi:YheO-like PAS domain protein [Vibrio aerogenes CECT 7868]|uniref:YheO-like PAS domain protein n=1 Tax=Vibrio aerogenes CECT 7868 TaxID=1216006 RepID=A0A1M5ZQZ9_9VIBR|nr:PAS domain-containing protein [Vibrio aerogenes]SHI26526.1 YheO-like PAS domain protein [Vibrio aerogenes CECT 7868]
MVVSKYKSFNTRFTEQDRACLTSNFRLAETIAELIGPHCEVVVHSFESFEHSVVKIVNGHHTGRKVGSPITDMGLKMLNQFEKTGNMTPESYFTTAKDGSVLKSTTCVLTGENEKPVGLFCINVNLSFPMAEILKTLVPDMTKMQSEAHETFSASPKEVIENALNHAIADVENDNSVTSKGKNKAITRVLFKNGIFELKEATTQVASQLGITRHAIYKYIREFRS